MSVSPHETLIRDYLEAVFNRHELDDLGSYWVDRHGLYRQLGVIPLGGDT